jgi:hypothetical protein
MPTLFVRQSTPKNGTQNKDPATESQDQTNLGFAHSHVLHSNRLKDKQDAHRRYLKKAGKSENPNSTHKSPVAN